MGEASLLSRTACLPLASSTFLSPCFPTFFAKKSHLDRISIPNVRSGHSIFGFFAAYGKLAHEQIFAKINFTYEQL